MSQKLAPIVVFVYNRPEHTSATMESLLKNDLASESNLFVFSDGWKNESDRPKVQEVRDYLKLIDGFSSIEIIERDRNYGLADSIIDGVTNIVNNYGCIIVLEDDILTSRYFLQYMNDSLKKYVRDDSIMHVAAYMPPIETNGLPETFFLRQSSCWGWGTWKRASLSFSKQGEKYINSFSYEDINHFNLDGCYDYWSQLLANEHGKLKTWAVYWYASIFNKGGLCLHPKVSLVNNIGFDGTGVNCGKSNRYINNDLFNRVTQFPDSFEENVLAFNRFKKFMFTSSKKNILNYKNIFKIFNFLGYE